MGTIADKTSNTPAPYKFELISSSGTIIAEPVEWKEGVTKIEREYGDADKSGGIFTTYDIDALTFVNSEAISMLWGTIEKPGLIRQFEIDTVCSLRVSVLNINTMSYEVMPTDYSLKAGSFKIKKQGNLAIAINIGCKNSSIRELIDERGDTDVDLTGLETIGGMTFERPDGWDENSRIKIPALNRDYVAKLKTKGLIRDNIFMFSWKLIHGYNSVPGEIVSNDFDEVSRVPFNNGYGAVDRLHPIFKNSKQDRSITLKYDLYIYVKDGFGSGHKNAVRIKYAIKNSDGEITETEIESFGQHSAMRNKTGSVDIDLEEGDSLYFFVKITSYSGDAYFARPDTSDYISSVKISENVIDTEESVFDGLPVYDALEISAKMMLDSSYPFYSETFAYSGKEYANGKTYDDIHGWSENQKFQGHICSGLNIRGLSITENDGKINFSWKKLFSSLNKMFGLQWFFCEIEGTKRLRVEKRGYVDSDEIILDLSDRINELDIESEYMSDLAFLQINYGYENYTYESNSGRAEFNTKYSRTTQMSATETLDLVSELNTAQTAIKDCLNMPIGTTGSEDTDQDSEIFFIKTQRDNSDPTNHKWKAETNENVTVLENSSQYGDNNSLNLYVAPSYCLLRNYDLISSALYVNQRFTGKLKFQTTDKLGTLKTRCVDYDFDVQENEDIPLSQLELPKFKPWKHSVNVYLTQEEFNLLLTGLNRFKLIKFTDNIQGRIIEVNKKNAENKAGIVIQEKI